MGCHKIGNATVCTGHASPPTDEHECQEAVWSEGRSCRRCEVDCYRKGWQPDAVSIDNKARVAKNRGSRL